MLWIGLVRFLLQHALNLDILGLNPNFTMLVWLAILNLFYPDVKGELFTMVADIYADKVISSRA